MADVTKLKKQVQKASDARDNAKIALGQAIDDYGAAERTVAIATEALESAEALEIARGLRANKGS